MSLRFGLAKKLLCVCLAFGLPIVVMWVLLTQAKLAEIRFAEKELAGDAFQRPLERVLQHVGRHFRLLARSEDRERGFGAEIAAAEHSVAAALAELELQDQKHGVLLQFTPAGLELRDRGRFTVAELRRIWDDVRTGPLSRDGRSGHFAITSHVRTMITHSGDTSNLILDPDLDSYYLMDATLLALPQLEERIQQLALTTEQIRGNVPNETALRRLEIARAFLQSDWDRVMAGVRTSIIEDPNFHGPSPSLEATLIPLLSAGEQKMQRVTAALSALSSGPSRGVDVPSLPADLEALDDAVYALHHAAFDEEDRLIQRRIDAFERSLYWGLALAAASVLVSALLAFALSSHILRRLQRLSAATRALASGNLDVQVGDAGSDELGALAQSFDVMTRRIGGLTAEVRQRAIELEQVNQGLEKSVDERTRELRNRNHAFKLILDNAHDGMLTVDLAGVVANERSVVVDRWFGTPAPGVKLGDYLAPDDPTLAAELALGLEQIESGFLPLEVTVAQLPSSMRAGKRNLRLSYQPITEDGTVSRLLVVLQDVTEELEGRQAAAMQEDVLRMFQACQRDRPGFLTFLMDSRDLVERITGQCSLVELRRAIHTLKGNCALFGVLGISKLCHEVENDLEQNGDILPSNVARIGSAWAELSEAVTRVAGEDQERAVEIADAEYNEILESIASGKPRRELIEAISRWKLEPVERRLRRLGDQARHLARRLGKEIEISIVANDVRMCAETWSPIWSALAHAIRNSVDHGIELPVERTQRGLPPAGNVRLEAREAGDQLIIEIADDGRGIQWEALARKAQAARMPHQSREELIEALFADGISSRDTVTDTSGRGVGMGALRQACRELGGVVELQTQSLQGTTVRCIFPCAAKGGRTLAQLSSLSIRESFAPVIAAEACAPA